MTIFSECKRQCVEARSEPLKKDRDGFDLCCVGEMYICSEESCVSTNKHHQPGYYKNRAIEMTNLVEGFRREILEGDE